MSVGVDAACARSEEAFVTAPARADDDAPLVERARAGDCAAFEELVRRHADRLHAVVLRLCSNRQEAEEITQEAFLRAWRGIGRFKGRSQFFTWLYRIGVNEASRRRNHNPGIGRVVSADDSPLEDVPDWSESPDLRAEQSQLREVLERAIAALPLDYRAPLVLRDVEGLTTAESAQAMDLGEAAFKSRLHRARLAVRRTVDLYYMESGDR